MRFRPINTALFAISGFHPLGASAAMYRRLSILPVLRLGIHPEVERPATLNRTMPSTAGATMSNLAFRIPTVRQSLDEEHHLHVWEKVHLMESSFPRRFCISAHI